MDGLFEFLQDTAIGYAIFDLLMYSTPLWLAVVVGLLAGWAWKPNWAKLDGAVNWVSSIMPSSSFPWFSSFPVELGSVQNLTNFQLPSLITWSDENETPEVTPVQRALQPSVAKPYILTEKDLLELHQLLEEEIDGPCWVKVLERSDTNIRFKGHRRNSKKGHLMYRTITIHEDITPEILRDFYWDDEFRSNWDAMHFKSDLLEECKETGAMLVHWIRKFPVVACYRDYTIARRIWQLGDSYYCICKGVPCTYITRRENAKKVDEFWSSWRIQPAKSERDGQLSASEITLFHYEDMGMPRGIAKFGVENGMWGTVKRIDPGLRAYLKYRASDPPLSRYVLLAHINTKLTSLPCTLLQFLEKQDGSTSSSSSEVETNKCSSHNKPAAAASPDVMISKLVVCVGALALACSFDRGFLMKALIFGVPRRLVRRSRRVA
ncbi:unnamed protein product [Cuscuta epithymum]|uniref:START domain-containing protein n=1 Tax=Cuscuta epithymum TaxID=186058 RepID=A0AAV0CH69_9ASTE|nr:unnamed protein product [Cuscuta epithymum]